MPHCTLLSPIPYTYPLYNSIASIAFLILGLPWLGLGLAYYSWGLALVLGPGKVHGPRKPSPRR